MNSLKSNLPVILLVAVVPYFFYNDPTISQSLIAIALCLLAGYKYNIEQKALPDYEKLFKKQIEDMAKNADDNFKKVEDQLISVKQKMGMEGYVNTQKKKLSEVPRGGSIW